ncbi:ABC transporter permease [Dactylosporangium maewongense]|uniref:ABC transporter permease n=1 Tax=Dactylosporangium maewongense TaxID=634393 RepID=A0ABP4MD18_9ACTN
MIWLTWRQHRKQGLYTLLGLAALAAFIVPTGLAMRRDLDRLVGQRCATGGELCDRGLKQFIDTYSPLLYVAVLLLAVPLLFGLFWGAPLVAREIEQGTHRMIWTQGISRRHWAWTKAGLLGGAVAVLAAGYGLGIAWWFEPLEFRESRFTEIFFDVQGVVPVGYTLFAVALGLYAGTLLPKVMSAMAVTLPAYIAARVAVGLYARPRFMAPLTRSLSIDDHVDLMAGTWLMSTEVRQADGTRVTGGMMLCRPEGDGGLCAAAREMGLRPGAYNYQVYQPEGRFWTFQWIETGIFVAAAALLVWLAIRRVRRIA